MNILVTGGAGYVGSVLVPTLLECGHDVTVVDNFMYRQHSLSGCYGWGSFSAVRADVRDHERIMPHVQAADAVILLADLVGAPICDQNRVDALLVNQEAKLNIIRNLHPEQRLIVPASESVYGANADVCTEETPTRPLSTYGKMKLVVEDAVMQRANSVSLRPGTAFGVSPRMRLDLLVNDFTWRAMHDRALLVFEGHYRRTLVHVQDLAAAFVHCIENFRNTRGQVFNVGDVTVSKLELCQEIELQMKEHDPEDPGFIFYETTTGRDPDQRNYVVSQKKLEATGYRADWNLAGGVRELLMCYRTLSDRRYSNA